MKTRAAWFWIVVVGQLALSVSTMGQTPKTGIPPFGSFSGGPDVVNIATGDVHYSIPIIQKTGRGIDFAYSLSYDSWIWIPTYSGSTLVWQPVASKTGSWGWQGLFPEGGTYVSYSADDQQEVCGAGGQGGYDQYTLNDFVYYDRNGTSHLFSASASDVGKINWIPGCPTDSEASPSSTTGFRSTDGSGYTLYLNPPDMADITGYVVDRDGTRFDVPVSFMPPGTAGTTTTTDRNGNQITSSNGVYTDTLGTTVLTVAGAAPSNTTLSYTAPSGATAKYVVSYKTYTVKTNFQCSGISEFGPTSESLVDKITLPDNSFYQFTYENTLGDPGDVTGRVASVTLPTGGSISYVYGGLHDGVECADGTTPGLERITPDTGSSWWTYTRTYGSGGASTTAVQDPQGNTTTINFSNGYETQRTITQGSNTLETVVTCYNGNSTNCPTARVTAPITQRAITVQWPGGLESQNVTSYNSYGLITEVDEYGYGTGSPGSLARKTVTSYASLGNGIVDKPASISVCSPGGSASACNGSGTLTAQTSYTYDQGSVVGTSGTPQHTSVSGSRGNATTVSSWVSSSSSLSKTFTYYDTGNVDVATDMNGAQTTYNYSNATVTCGNAFPSSITEPISPLSKSFTWTCTGGVQLTVTDENGKTTTTAYSDADYWRPASVTDATNAVTDYYYQPNPTYTLPFTVATSMSFGNSVVEHVRYMDGLGRPLDDQVLEGPGSSTLDTISYSYDPEDRLSTAAGPCATGYAGPCSTPSKTTTHDALGRPLTVTDSGGLSATYQYNANDVLETVGPAPSGENVKQKQYEYDALGRLTSVCEITNASGSGPCPQTHTGETGYFTQYTYDALGDLATVTQGGGAQTRSYNYDGLGRMTSETNPESGVTNYSWDSDSTMCGNGAYSSNGDLVKTTDAAGNCVMRYYDALHRLTDVGNNHYSATNPCKRFRYDNSTGILGSRPNGVVSSNGYGRLTEAETDTCAWPVTQSSIVTDEWFSYDARGETTDVWESTPHSGLYYHSSATYWANGVLDSLGESTSGYGLVYSLDGEGRINSAGDSVGSTDYLSSTTYNSASQPLQVNFASGDGDTFQYDVMNRMNKYTLSVNGQSVVGSPAWNPNGSLGSLSITDPFNSADAQNCTYTHDDLARLATANCTGSGFSGTYSYGAFGNLTKTGTDTFNATYNSATNQMSSIGGQTPGYDADGNVLNDFLNTYSWDAYGRPITVNNTGVTYDAFGRAVEMDKSGTYSQFVYSPTGFKMEIMNGGSLVTAFAPLTGGASRVYEAGGFYYYRHADWLGSSRLASTPSRTVYYDGAYGPFGEQYAGSGTPDLNFTGMNQDISANVYDFPAREYGIQGRWPSPDPAGLAAVNPMDPQTWNRYAYVRNSPLEMTDPFGTDPCTSGLQEQCTNAGQGSGCIGGTPGSTTFEECGGYAGMPSFGGWFLDSEDPGVGCTLDGFDAACGLVESAMDSGAAAQCPDNNCTPGLVYRGNSFEQWTYSRQLEFVCNGDSADDCALTHDWYVWVSNVDPNNRGRFDVARWDQFTGGPCNGPCISSSAQKVLGGASGMASYALTCTADAMMGKDAILGNAGGGAYGYMTAKGASALETGGGILGGAWAGGLAVAFFNCYW